jgi:hypothetical protein
MIFYKHRTAETQFAEWGISLSPTKLGLYTNGQPIHTHRRFAVFKYKTESGSSLGFGVDVSVEGLHIDINIGKWVFGMQLFYKDDF